MSEVGYRIGSVCGVFCAPELVLLIGVVNNVRLFGFVRIQFLRRVQCAIVGCFLSEVLKLVIIRGGMSYRLYIELFFRIELIMCQFVLLSNLEYIDWLERVEVGK